MDEGERRRAIMTEVRSALQLEGVKKKKGTFALGPIGLHLESGMVHALVGANGSGKSTLFNLCMNLLQPQEGSVMVHGLNYTEHDLEIQRKIAYTPEP